jgi:hypothetical protein
VTVTSTAALRDAIDDLDRADLDTEAGRNRALHAIEYLDAETGRIREYITACGDQP